MNFHEIFASVKICIRFWADLEPLMEITKSN